MRAAARAAEQGGLAADLAAGQSGPARRCRRAATPTSSTTTVQSAQDYGDTYALSYNPTFVRFDGADCADFASQCARAGSMPQASGAATSGWWYDKGGTSSPSNDTYSLSWINVTGR